MLTPLSVTGEKKGDVVVLTVKYAKDFLRHGSAFELFRDRLVEQYTALRPTADTSSGAVCVVQVDTEISGSPLVRALFELYETVASDRGRLIIADFPPDYIPQLASLGLTSLKGFELAADVDEAISLAQRPH